MFGGRMEIFLILMGALNNRLLTGILIVRVFYYGKEQNRSGGFILVMTGIIKESGFNTFKFQHIAS